MEKLQIGGQAVLEGVMMRGRNHWVVAIRKSNKEIVVEERKINSLSKRFPFLNYFILRGVLVLIETIILAVQALSLSAQEVEEEVEITTKEMVFTISLATVLGGVLFVVLPAWMAKLLEGFVSGPLTLSIIEGLIRIVIFIGYLFAISSMKDIARVFEYHGAEHKVIRAYESGDELSPEATSKYSTLHVSCGTSFLLVVMVLVIFVFALLGSPPLLIRILARLPLIPLVAGVSYEIIKVARKYQDSNFVRFLMIPGLLLQKMTTREPSIDQLEVAIHSLKTLLSLEMSEGTEEVEVLP
ncbi:MAG: DUF1385 domain-containing protein [Actinomycetota bacterium]|nr:DUF1385 domain-containing protein [Actinomycetota bacterium]